MDWSTIAFEIAPMSVTSPPVQNKITFMAGDKVAMVISEEGVTIPEGISTDEAVKIVIKAVDLYVRCVVAGEKKRLLDHIAAVNNSTAPFNAAVDRAICEALEETE